MMLGALYKDSQIFAHRLNAGAFSYRLHAVLIAISIAISISIEIEIGLGNPSWKIGSNR